MEQKENPILGNGKFKVSACKGKNSIRGNFYALAITPHKGKPKKVGEKLSKDELIPFIDDSKDIAIYFINVEAIDVVINNLKKVRKYIEDDMENNINPDEVFKKVGYGSEEHY
ncbi:MAG: hypothetical protein C0625_08065 [Arcobacter sp.]|nr:MAG: hypothetical protein C0625_08065 [Arcobacter sp.]